MKKDVFWGYASQFLQYGSALLVLPLLLRELSSAELGVWYIFMTISVLANMLDMGFSPTLARNVSYVLSGAKHLQKDGYEVIQRSDEKELEVDYGLLRSIISASKRIFFLIALATLILLAAPGTLYILNVTRGEVANEVVLQAWSVFICATALNLFFKYYTPLLQGRSLFGQLYKSNALASLAFVAVTAALLKVGLGLLAIAHGYLVSALLGRWLSHRYLYDATFKAKLAHAPKHGPGTLEVFWLMWHNAWRLGCGAIGAFLILRANTLLSSIYLGLEATATYALSMQVFAILQSVSTVVFNTQLPKLAQYRVQNQREALLKTMERGIASALSIFLFGALILLWQGAPLIKLIGGHTELLPPFLLAWMAGMMFLELNHSLSAGVIVTGNKVPFVKPAILSGCFIVFLSWLGLKYGGLGITGLIGAQFFVQIAYNNWKWPLLIYKEFYVRRT